MSWFKKRPSSPTSFRDYAPDGLFDVHAHLLPNLDDGARSNEESVAILDGLATLGFVKVAATPHFSCRRNHQPSRRRQEESMDRIQGMRDHRLPEVVSGAETVLDDLFLDAEAAGLVPAIGNGPTYLVEFGFSPASVPLGVENVVFRFRVKEKFLVLAHPERTHDFQGDLDRLALLRRSGMLVQIDVMSLVGTNGRRAEKAAFRMLEDDLVDVMATDIHAPSDLIIIEQALRTLVEWDREEFQRLVSHNPRLLLDGKACEVMRYE